MRSATMRAAGGALGEEITQRAVEGAGEADGLAIAGEKGEGAFDLAHGLGPARQDAGTGLVHGHVVNLVGGRVDEIDHAFDVFVHKIS